MKKDKVVKATKEETVKMKDVKTKETKVVKTVKDNKSKIVKDKKGVTKEKKARVSIFAKIANYFKGVHKEMKKVRWPSKKELVLYSGATLGFIIIFALFFTLNDVVISAVKQLVR